MKKLLLTFAYIFLLFLSLHSQTEYDGLRIPYDPCSPCSGSNITYNATEYFDEPDQVASDFGPRYVVTGSPPNERITSYD